MGKIVAITNFKGGVGKTATALNLGAALSDAEKKVLLIDNDPQGNLTAALGYTPAEQKRTLANFLLAAIDYPEDLEIYDYIIIDCGLKHELLTVNALAASDYCIIPVQSHFLASEGVPDVLDMVRSIKEKFNPRLEVAGILLTMYQTRPQLCRSVRESVVDIYGGSYRVFERPIEYSIKVAECPAAGQSIFEYAPKNAAAESYRSLAREVLCLG